MINLNDEKYRSRGDGEDEKLLHQKMAKNSKLGIVEIGVLNSCVILLIKSFLMADNFFCLLIVDIV